MAIPFYRYVGYAEDGVYVYECLQCKTSLPVQLPYYAYSPRFCSYCGVEFGGFVLPKKEDWVDSIKTEVLAFQLQAGHDYSMDKNGEIEWKNFGFPKTNLFQEFEYMKKMRKQSDEEEKNNKNDPWFCKTFYRIIPVRKTEYHSYINIDPDK